MFRCGGRKRSGCKRLWQRRARDEWRGEQPFKTDKCCVVSDFGSRWLLFQSVSPARSEPDEGKATDETATLDRLVTLGRAEC